MIVAWAAPLTAVALGLGMGEARWADEGPPAHRCRVSVPRDRGPDPYRPGRTLHGRTLHVPQGSTLVWEAWQQVGRAPSLASSSRSVLPSWEELGVARGGLTLTRMVLAVPADAPVDTVARVWAEAGPGAPWALAHERHDQAFALTIHVVRGQRYPGP